MSKLFPELEGDLAPETAPFTLPEAERAGEKIVIGGSWSSNKYEQLMGLPGPFKKDGGCRVLGAKAFSDGRIEIEVSGGGFARKVVWFLPRKAQKAGEDFFDVGCPGSSADELLKKLMGQIAVRLSKVSLAALRKVVLVDPEKKIETVARKSGPNVGPNVGPSNGANGGNGPGPDEVMDGNHHEPKDMLKSLVQAYDSREAWFNFFADKEQERNFCHNISGSMVTIGHEDLECHYATPKMGDGTVSFFNYPRVHTSANPMAENAEDRVGPKSESGDSYLISDLQDLDIIKGGAQKLDRLLDTVIERETKPDMVIMRATCVPIVIGDDMEGSVDRFRAKSDIPIVYLDNIGDQFATPFRETFRRVKDDPEFKNPVKKPGSINLIGFPKITEIASLISFLERINITINCRMLPEIELNVMKRYRAAELAVLYDTVRYDKAYAEVIGDIDLKSLRLAPPYGMAGSKRWLAEIARTLGREDGFEETWTGTYGQVEADWDELKKQTAGMTLGFVIDSEKLKKLLEPRLMTGVPILAMLKEMGFALEFLFYDDGKDRQALEAMALGKNKVAAFSTPEELESRLKSSQAQAFYSEVFFDRRLTRSGKAQFSVQQFQLGPDGAVATLKRLLSVCRIPFYRKYGNYLGEAFPA